MVSSRFDAENATWWLVDLFVENFAAAFAGYTNRWMPTKLTPIWDANSTTYCSKISWMYLWEVHYKIDTKVPTNATPKHYPERSSPDKSSFIGRLSSYCSGRSCNISSILLGLWILVSHLVWEQSLSKLLKTLGNGGLMNNQPSDHF